MLSHLIYRFAQEYLTCQEVQLFDYLIDERNIPFRTYCDRLKEIQPYPLENLTFKEINANEVFLRLRLARWPRDDEGKTPLDLFTAHYRKFWTKPIYWVTSAVLRLTRLHLERIWTGKKSTLTDGLFFGVVELASLYVCLKELEDFIKLADLFE